METLGWNPLLDERSHRSSIVFPGLSGATTAAQTSSRPVQFQQSKRPMNLSIQRPHSSVRFSETGDDVDSLLPMASPAFSTSPGVFFEDQFAMFTGDQQTNQQRSPSLGIGSSLAVPKNYSYPEWRPCSVAQDFFPKVGSELPFDYVRAKSAIPAVDRPGSSAADWRNDYNNDSPSPTKGDSIEHWTDWNIKTAPGCPSLETLFENKRKWREKFNQSIPPPLQRHCVFCKSISKPPEDYLSHAIRDANGEITCPVLNAYNCPKCGRRGHTVRYCSINQSRNNASSNSSSQSSLQGARNRSRLGSISSAVDSLGVESNRFSKSSMGFY